MVPRAVLMKCRICASVWTDGPGTDSGPTVRSLAVASSRSRLKACTSTSWSVVEASQLGSTSGRTAVSDELMVTVPRDNGATRTAMNEAWLEWLTLGPSPIAAEMNSMSGQSDGNCARSESAFLVSWDRDFAGSFSHAEICSARGWT